MVNYGDWREALGVVFVATWTWKGVEIQRGGEIRKQVGRLERETRRGGGDSERGRLGRGSLGTEGDLERGKIGRGRIRRRETRKGRDSEVEKLTRGETQ